jgi:hypothetical protein
MFCPFAAKSSETGVTPDDYSRTLLFGVSPTGQLAQNSIVLKQEVRMSLQANLESTIPEETARWGSPDLVDRKLSRGHLLLLAHIPPG